MENVEYSSYVGEVGGERGKLKHAVERSITKKSVTFGNASKLKVIDSHARYARPSWGGIFCCRFFFIFSSYDSGSSVKV